MKEKIERVLQTAMDEHEISGGSVLICRGGSTLCRVDMGLADIKAGIPYSEDTIIRLFSMSKPITSAAIMILLERGIIERSDPVSKYIPSFKDQKYYAPDGTKHPVSREATIGDLLDMTAGLSYPDDSTYAGTDASLVFSEIEKRLDTPDEMDTMEVADAIGRCTLAFDPGSAYLYSTCADVLGAVAEAATGKKFSAFLKDEILSPLGMEDTDFLVPAKKQSRLARSYVPASHLHEHSPKEMPSTDDEFPEYLGNNLGIKSRMASPNAFESGGAGLASTLNDYMRFGQMLLNGGTTPDGHQILSPATVAYMTGKSIKPPITEGFYRMFDLKGFSYGNLLRVAVDPSSSDTLMSPGEYGWDGWLGPYFANMPDPDLTLLIAIQRTESGTIHLTRRIRNIVLSSI